MEKTEFDIMQTLECMMLDIAQLKKLLQAKEKPEETIDYEVNWVGAPEWALAHAYDETGDGFFYGPHADYYNAVKRFASYEASGLQIGESVMEIHKKTWKNSITLRPLNF